MDLRFNPIGVTGILPLMVPRMIHLMTVQAGGLDSRKNLMPIAKLLHPHKDLVNNVRQLTLQN